MTGKLFFHPLMKVKGYSLIELIVVMLLISLVLALVSLNFSRALPGVELKAAVRDLSSVLRRAKNNAELKGKETTVTIDLDNQQYWLDGRKQFHIDADIEITIVDPVDGGTATGKYNIFFYPGGGSSGVKIFMQTETRLYNVKIDPVTGNVSVTSEDSQG